MSPRTLWKTAFKAANDFVADDLLVHAAALAFYTALSMAPLLVIVIWMTGQMSTGVQIDLVDQTRQLVGPEGATVVGIVVESAEENPSVGSFAGVLSIATLLFSASAVFAQLQTALNRIWDVQVKPGRGIWNWLRKRLLTMGMVFALGFLLLVSLVVSASLSALHKLVHVESDVVQNIWQSTGFLVSMLVYIAMFALVYKILPDVRFRWHMIWVGALSTTILFSLGKLVIGLYLGNSSIGSAYGAAGSLVVFLVWTYYASVIVFFGAELTQAYAHITKAPLVPSQHAEWASHPKGGTETEEDTSAP